MGALGPDTCRAVAVQSLVFSIVFSIQSPAHFFDLGGPSHYSGNYPIGFEHCGAHFFDLGGPSHYSGNYPIGFEHCDVAEAPDA